MKASPDEAARLEALERHTAHQEQVIDDLNAAVTKQWVALEAMQRRLALLEGRLEAEEERRAESLRPPG